MSYFEIMEGDRKGSHVFFSGSYLYILKKKTKKDIAILNVYNLGKVAQVEHR